VQTPLFRTDFIPSQKSILCTTDALLFSAFRVEPSIKWQPTIFILRSMRRSRVEQKDASNNLRGEECRRRFEPPGVKIFDSDWCIGNFCKSLADQVHFSKKKRKKKKTLLI
jgi:hypothetical protein